MVYRRPFASKAVFERCEGFWVRLLLFLIILLGRENGNSKSFKIAQKNAFEAKGRRYTKGNLVIGLLFRIDLYTYLATQSIVIGEANGKSSTFTHTSCAFPVHRPSLMHSHKMVNEVCISLKARALAFFVNMSAFKSGQWVNNFSLQARIT